MPDVRYDRDYAFRGELTELLDEHGYSLESFQLADKEKLTGQERIVTIKAGRSLIADQARLPLET